MRPIWATCGNAGPDPDLCVLGGHTQARGQGGRPGPLWVQGKALVGGLGGRSPRRKMIFSVLEWLEKLSVALFCKKNHSFQFIFNRKEY